MPRTSPPLTPRYSADPEPSRWPWSWARPPAPAQSRYRPPTAQAPPVFAQASAERDDAWCTIRPILGGVAGAFIGYLLLKDAEMGALIGPLAGAVVGSVLFRCWERELALPPPRR